MTSKRTGTDQARHERVPQTRMAARPASGRTTHSSSAHSACGLAQRCVRRRTARCASSSSSVAGLRRVCDCVRACSSCSVPVECVAWSARRNACRRSSTASLQHNQTNKHTYTRRCIYVTQCSRSLTTRPRYRQRTCRVQTSHERAHSAPPTCVLCTAPTSTLATNICIVIHRPER